MPSRALLRQASEAVQTGLTYLIAEQDQDGFWRDYELHPGASEAWTTSWVGWCLAHLEGSRPMRASLLLASQAVVGSLTTQGWGYNRNGAADADSSAWALRFLTARAYACGHWASQILAPFTSPNGAVRTFANPQTGTWSDAHADVAAIAGLALLESHAERDLTARVCSRLAATMSPDGTWPSFWWASDVYPTVWGSLLLLALGQAPQRGIQWVASRLEAQTSEQHLTPLELSLGIILLAASDRPESCLTDAIADLIEGQLPSRNWPGSRLLLVPARGEGTTELPVGPHADTKGLVTTAMACLALSRWIAARREPLASRRFHAIWKP